MKRKQIKKSLILSHYVSSGIAFEAPETGSSALAVTVTHITKE